MRSRLARITPFVSQRIPFAIGVIRPSTVLTIDRQLGRQAQRLGKHLDDFLTWLRISEAEGDDAQRALVALRFSFNALTTNVDVFSDVLLQRTEGALGEQLAGLDVAARDALDVPYVRAPPAIVCYVDRGHGAAIRRARTRLPGGGANPVAIIRVPRERMLGIGIAASLFHEVGHQGSALLDLPTELRSLFQQQSDRRFRLWDRWIGEVLADVWAVSRLGAAATLGLISVMGLPRAFVMRLDAADPHPPPWLRVRLSCAMGAAMFPDPIWARLLAMWTELYPLKDGSSDEPLRALEETVPAVVEIILTCRPASLKGMSVGPALHAPECDPQRIVAIVRRGVDDEAMARLRPSVALSALAMARFTQALPVEEESPAFERLLGRWARDDVSSEIERCAPRAAVRRRPRHDQHHYAWRRDEAAVRDR